MFQDPLCKDLASELREKEITSVMHILSSDHKNVITTCYPARKGMITNL